MKIKKILPKSPETILIPVELQDFLVKNIYQAYLANSDEAVLESDDGIQNDIACAGLIDKNLQKFIVSYYPDVDHKFCWYFSITLNELKEIADGKKHSLSLWKCNGVDCRNKENSEDFACLIHDFVDDGTGDSEIVKNIDKLTLKEMLDQTYGPKKSK